ncbi:MAG: hypothetical protein ACOCRO_01050 [Halanaerobiales bacterium]
MWLEVEYIPTALFSFKDINATNTAATTLLFPTPFAVKMGLISQCIQKYDIEKAENLFSGIKKKEMGFSLPDIAVINKTFGRINDLRNRTGRSKPAYREYVYFKGVLKVAINIENMDIETVKILKELFIRINYFGKKGSFMQYKRCREVESISSDYVSLLNEDYNLNLSNKSIIQQTEDIPAEASFEAINIYNSDEKLNRKDNEKVFVVNVMETFSGEGYQYFTLTKNN